MKWPYGTTVRIKKDARAVFVSPKYWGDEFIVCSPEFAHIGYGELHHYDGEPTLIMLASSFNSSMTMTDTPIAGATSTYTWIGADEIAHALCIFDPGTIVVFRDAQRPRGRVVTPEHAQIHLGKEQVDRLMAEHGSRCVWVITDDKRFHAWRSDLCFKPHACGACDQPVSDDEDYLCEECRKCPNP